MKQSNQTIVTDEITNWEREYHLPKMCGTQEKVESARLVRHQFLSHVFENILDETASLDAAVTTNVYDLVDDIRAFNDAQHWSKCFRLQLEDPTGFVVMRALDKAMELAERKRLNADAAVRSQKATQTRKLTASARKWEQKNALPELIADSKPTVNLGRRCRYLLCNGDPEQARRRSTEAEYWIVELTKANLPPNN